MLDLENIRNHLEPSFLTTLRSCRLPVGVSFDRRISSMRLRGTYSYYRFVLVETCVGGFPKAAGIAILHNTTLQPPNRAQREFERKVSARAACG